MRMGLDLAEVDVKLRSSREFAVDHANLHSDVPWYQKLTAKDAATLVGVVVDDKAEDTCVEELASALKPSSFKLTAVSQTTQMVTGYVTMCMRNLKSRSSRSGRSRLTAATEAKA